MLLGTSYSYAQNLTGKNLKRYKQAYEYAEDSNNRKAINMLQQIYKSNPDDIDVNFNLGLCYLNMSGNPDSALFFLNRTWQLDTDTEWTEGKSELKMAMARVKQLKYDYDAALEIYNEVEKNDTQKLFAQHIARERFICANAKTMMSNPVRLEVHKLNSSVNSGSNDYRPLVSHDQHTLVFTSRRRNDVETRFDDGQSEEHTYMAEVNADGSWSKAVSLDGVFSSKGQETATCLCDSELYLVRDGNIYVSLKDSASGEWTKARKLGSPVNSRYEERYAFVTEDGNEMYFSSNRPGGCGGFDIYRSYRLPNGEWGVPKNLGPVVNSEFDEDAPVMHPTKNILYFSSNGHNTMGGFDIFYTLESLSDSTYEAVQNIGYPINTPDDDLYFVPTAQKDMAYYASINWNGTGDEFTGYDLYEVEYEEPEVNRLVIISGKVESQNMASVQLTASLDGEPFGRYIPNVNTGKFVIIVEEGAQYDITVDNGTVEKKLSVSTKVGDSYYKMGHVVSLETFSFVEEEIAAERVTLPEDTAAMTTVDSPEIVVNDYDKGYTVQVFALKSKLDPSRVKGIDPEGVLEHVYRDGWYVYSYGQYSDKRDARDMKSRIREVSPYKDAFVRNMKSYKKYTK